MTETETAPAPAIHRKGCSVCNHPDRAAIETEIGAGGSYRKVGKRWGVDFSVLCRHYKGHVLSPEAQTRLAELEARHAAPLDASEGEVEVLGARAVVQEAERLRRRAIGFLSKAEVGRDFGAAARFIREARECLALQAKLTGQISDAPVTINVTQNIVAVQQLMIEALASYPEARLAVVRALEHVA